MTPFAEHVAAWHEFYLATAGAAAVLMGLIFVGGPHMPVENVPSLTSARPFFVSSYPTTPLMALAGQTYAIYSYVMLMSLAMLFPAESVVIPVVGELHILPTAVVLFLAGLGSVETSRSAFRAYRLAHGERERLVGSAFVGQHLLPAGAMLVAESSGLAFAIGSPVAIVFYAGMILALLATAGRNTFEMYRRRGPEKASTSSTTARPQQPSDAITERGADVGPQAVSDTDPSPMA